MHAKEGKTDLDSFGVCENESILLHITQSSSEVTVALMTLETALNAASMPAARISLSEDCKMMKEKPSQNTSSLATQVAKNANSQHNGWHALPVRCHRRCWRHHDHWHCGTCCDFQGRASAELRGRCRAAEEGEAAKGDARGQGDARRD